MTTEIALSILVCGAIAILLILSGWRALRGGGMRVYGGYTVKGPLARLAGAAVLSLGALMAVFLVASLIIEIAGSR